MAVSCLKEPPATLETLRDGNATSEVVSMHDFAFIRRSNGSWTYAIVADFPTPSSIRFVTDTKGSTKTLKKEHWVKSVRLVNMKSEGSFERILNTSAYSAEDTQSDGSNFKQEEVHKYENKRASVSSDEWSTLFWTLSSGFY